MFFTLFLACIDADDLSKAIENNQKETECNEINPEFPCEETIVYDKDGDGYVLDEYTDASGLTGGDCDDEDASIHPDAEDIWYDGVDSNCDERNDYDKDGDGYVLDEYTDVSGFTGGDCDDEDASIHPDTEDIWYDGVDSNCDGADDFDQDNDGFISEEHAELSPLTVGDCDDQDSTVYEGAEDTWYDGIDSNCDGADDFDQDSDGFISEEHAERSPLAVGDCDDQDNSIYDGAVELCDGKWNNCILKDAISIAPDDEIDNDNDGYIECSIEDPSIFEDSLILGGNDCDDSKASVYLGATELCDNLDNDCDGLFLDTEIDHDGDGAIECDPTGQNGSTEYWGPEVPNFGDCDEENPLRNEFLEEICDGIDNDCDQLIDEALPVIHAGYYDEDGDGYGTTNTTTILHCGVPPEGYSILAGDCNDSDASIKPEIVCDGVDNDCDNVPEVVIYATSELDYPSNATRFCISNEETLYTNVQFPNGIDLYFYPYANNVTDADPVISCGATGGHAWEFSGGQRRNIEIHGITFADCTIQSPIKTSSPGIFILDDVTFSSNIGQAGGALNISDNTTSFTTNVFIKNSVFFENSSIVGGAIYLKDARLQVEDSVFTSNTALNSPPSGTLSSLQKKYGGAIYAEASTANNARLNVKNTIFEDNIAENGGAISITSAPLDIENSDFYENEATYQGGAIKTDQTNFILSKSYFYGNTAHLGSAIRMRQSISDISATTFAEHIDTIDGVVHIEEGSPHKLYNTTFTDNESEMNSTLQVRGNPNSNTYLEIHNSYFSRNIAPIGGMSIYRVQMNLRNTILSYNQSIGPETEVTPDPLDPSNIIPDNYVGGAFFDTLLAGSIIDGLTVDNNSAISAHGTAIGGIKINEGSFTQAGVQVSNSIVSNNIATTEGDLYCQNCTDPFAGIAYVTWNAVNTYGNRKYDSTNNVYVPNNTSVMSGTYPLTHFEPIYKTNTSNMNQDYRLDTSTDVALLDEGYVTPSLGMDPFKETRSYGAYGGNLADKWDLDGDGYMFCYSLEAELDCECLDQNDFVENTDICEP